MIGSRRAARTGEARINPWLLGKPSNRETSYPEQISSSVPPSTAGRPPGPLDPQFGRGRPDSDTMMPIRAVERSAGTRLLVAGVHGGSGESRIASLDPSWEGAGRAFPDASSGAAPVLLCCRAHVPGLLAAQAAATQWGAGSVAWLRLLGLVITADTQNRAPKPIRDLTRVVAGGVPHSWLLPWYEPWRLGDSPPPEQLPQPFRRLVTHLDRLLDDDHLSPRSPGAIPIPEGIPHAQP